MKIKQAFRLSRLMKFTKGIERRKIFFLLRLYSKLDKDIEQFSFTVGLKCASGCGRCCKNPHVETTVLELQPVAIELFRKNEADQWVNKAVEAAGQGRCVFYKPDPLIPSNGRCSVYPLRPLVCRLFGFSAIT